MISYNKITSWSDEEKMIFYCNNARNEYKKAFSIYAQILEEDINAFDYMD